MKPLNIKSISLLAASLLPVISIAQSSLELSITPTTTYPADGANVESLDHVERKK